MNAPQLVPVASFGGCNASVHEATVKPTNKDAPILIMLHSFSSDGELYKEQFEDPTLTSVFNMIAVDEYGHGGTGGNVETLTYWDQAKMVLEVMDAKKIEKAFILGTSQGGFIAARMALLQPTRVSGIILCGSSLQSESTKHGSWDIEEVMAGSLPTLESAAPTPDFILPQGFTDSIIQVGWSGPGTVPQQQYIRKVHEKVYCGDEGRRRYLMILNCLAKRDNLSDEQLASIKCPILVAHGTADAVYTVPLMKEWAKEMTGSSHKEVEVVEGGAHFLTSSHPAAVQTALLGFYRAVKA